MKRFVVNRHWTRDQALAKCARLEQALVTATVEPNGILIGPVKGQGTRGTWSRTCTVVLGALVLSLTAGCGEGEGRQKISGEVTFQNKPVDQGSIEFLPGPGVPSHAGAVIENGRYTIPANKGLVPGLYAIKISWPERQVRTDETPGVPVGSRDLIPPKYNSKTTLTREVQQGANVIDFHLE